MTLNEILWYVLAGVLLVFVGLYATMTVMERHRRAEVRNVIEQIKKLETGPLEIDRTRKADHL